MFGDYPSSMRSRVGNRLPKFSPSEVALVKGSLDFVGINHYTTFYARNNSTNLIGILLHDSIADSGAITLRMFQIKHYQAIIYFVSVL
jgi:beta-glucosidase